jgi:DNA primase
MNNSYFANQIKMRVKMPEILRRYGFDIDRNKRVRCPFHNGTDRNCGVKDDYIHCFVCGESADQIGFVQKYFSLSFSDAVSKINDDFCLGLTIGERIDKRRQTDMAKQAFLQKQEQKKKQQEHEKLLENWVELNGEYIRLYRNKKMYSPSSPEEEPHPLFVEALQNLDHIKYAAIAAGEELIEYERKHC